MEEVSGSAALASEPLPGLQAGGPAGDEEQRHDHKNPDDGLEPVLVPLADAGDSEDLAEDAARTGDQDDDGGGSQG
ncbi:hypothetical protein ACIQH9_08110 [Pseudarthrobacter oxydans]|uniref:hypothetical protein n=1 Tax=Pseudarthrobacter oxydans TaxID=1671 RepID=UPI0037FA752A